MHYSCMQNTLHIHLIWLRTKRNTVSVLYRYPQCIPIIICRFTFLWKMKKMKKSNVNMTGYNQKYWQKVQDNFVTKSPHCMNHLANKTNVQLITIKYLNWLTTVWLTQSTSKHCEVCGQVLYIQTWQSIRQKLNTRINDAYKPLKCA